MSEWMGWRGMFDCPIRYKLKKRKSISKYYPTNMTPTNHGACTYVGEDKYIITLSDELVSGKYDEEQIYACIVHEALHLWWKILNKIGEDNPSEEFQCYSVQNIVQDLFYQYKKLYK